MTIFALLFSGCSWAEISGEERSTEPRRDDGNFMFMEGAVSAVRKLGRMYYIAGVW